MTYCVGILVEDGLVMIADTRTNVGLDNISTYRKLSITAVPGERVLVLASAGNLSLSQSVVSLLTEGLENSGTGEIETLRNAPTLFRAAQLVGRAVRQVRAVEGKAFEEEDLPFNLCFLLGGQTTGEPMALYMVDRAGNSIRCERDVPFLQIGEHKYGKPILDRAVSYRTGVYDALKIGLISMDSTMRSNLGCRASDRHRRGPPRCGRGGGASSHRGGRALLPRSARTLVGGAPSGSQGDPAPPLRFCVG